MDKLLIYDDINNIDFSKLDDNFDLIITSYNETGKLLTNKFKNKVISIGSISESIFENWNNKELDYSNIVELRKKLDESEYVPIEIIQSFTKSIDDIYNSIKLAKELRITSEEYNADTLEEQLFLKLMDTMYIQNSFIDFEIKLFNYEYDIKFFKDDINKSLKECLDINNFYDDSTKTKNILIIGFFYITPLQELIFNYFRKSGINIVPMMCYDKRYKKINEIVDITFESYSKYKIDSLDECDSLYTADLYASILDGKDIDVSNIKDSDKLIFKYYSDLNVYNKNVVNLIYNEDYIANKKLYAVNRKGILDRISIFRGDLEESDKISIKYYPIGIFLKEIYHTWNNRKRKVCLNMESLLRIFECDFLEIDKGYKTSDYIEDLNLLSVQFENCDTIGEWIERISELSKSKSNIKCNITYKELENSYGPLSINETRIDVIENIFKLLKDITDIIFFDKKGNIDTDILVHLDNLNQILAKDINIENHDDESIEYELLKKIEKILENKQGSSKASARNEYLFKALSLYISNIDIKKDSKKRALDIYPLDSIEAIEDSIKEIFIYDFDRNNFPQQKFKELMFLNENKLNDILKSREKETLDRKILDIYMKLIKSNEIIGRYVFWLALKNKNIKKTLYRFIEDKDNKHFYQYILENKLNKQSNEVKNKEVKSSLPEAIDLSEYKISSVNNNDIDLKSAYLYMYCPLRAYFAKINNKEVYMEKVSTEHFIPNVLAHIEDKTGKDVTTVLSNFNQYSTVVINRFKKIYKSYTNNYNNSVECYWLPTHLKLNKSEDKLPVELDYLDAYFKSKNTGIKNGFMPIANNGKFTCTYCPSKKICVEKNLNIINNTSKHSNWRLDELNYQYIKRSIGIRKKEL